MGKVVFKFFLAIDSSLNSRRAPYARVRPAKYYNLLRTCTYLCVFLPRNGYVGVTIQSSE